MWLLIIAGLSLGVLAVGNLATGYVEWGAGFALLAVGAFILAFMTHDYGKGNRDATPRNSTLSRPSPVDSRRQSDIESKFQVALTRVAGVIGDTNDSREIIRRFESELERNDQDAEIWHALSQSYGEGGDLRRAHYAAETAVRLNPSEGRYHFSLSAILMIACSEAVSPDPESLGVTHMALGLGYSEALTKAEFHARETLRLGAIAPFESQARENLFTMRLMKEMSPE